MKVIITKRFEKKYLSKITKYFKKHHLAIELKSKEHKIIHLNK
jgi:hypothetical protein